jgi:hypothetical protein
MQCPKNREDFPYAMFLDRRIREFPYMYSTCEKGTRYDRACPYDTLIESYDPKTTFEENRFQDALSGPRFVTENNQEISL